MAGPAMAQRVRFGDIGLGFGCAMADCGPLLDVDAFGIGGHDTGVPGPLRQHWPFAYFERVQQADNVLESQRLARYDVPAASCGQESENPVSLD